MTHDPTHNWMTHLQMILLGIRSFIGKENISPANLVYGIPLHLPGQLLEDPATPPPSSFASDLENFMALATPLPVIFHGYRAVRVPQALALVASVCVQVDTVQTPLSRPYESHFPVISRSAKTFCLNDAQPPAKV